MRFPKPPVRKCTEKQQHKDGEVYTTPITTTVTVQIRQKFDEFNQQNSEKITWSEAIRRGFFSILREKEGTVMDDLASGRADYIPIQARERINRLAQKLQEMSQEVHILQGHPKQEAKPDDKTKS